MSSSSTSFNFGLENWTGVVVATLLLLLVTCVLVHRKRKRRDLPPSPKGVTVLRAFTSCLAKEFSSPLTYLNLGGQDVVILNDYQAAVDILEKRSANYSSRPHLIVAAEYIGMNKSIAFLPYGETWRHYRSAVQREMTPGKARSYLPLQTAETRLLMRNMIRDPEMWRESLFKWSGNIILKICYGLDSESECEKVLKEIENVLEPVLEAILCGSNLVDVFPFLDHLPDFLSPWRRRALQLRKQVMELFVGLIHQVDQKVTRGEFTPDSTLAAYLWSSRATLKLDELDVAYLAGSVLDAGVHTTYGTMAVFVLAMVMYPAVFTAAKTEIDEVCGAHSPTMDDIERLPYITALCKETMRWRAVAPIGGPRQATTTQDDFYKGMRIPAGAIVIANQYGMSFSGEETYGQTYDVEIFEPRRWIDRPEGVGDMFDGNFGFGFGRRVCPGKHLAAQSLFLAISNLCYSFDIKAKEGVAVDPEKFSAGIVMHPEPFQCNITPRAGRAGQIESEAQAALEACRSL